MDKFEEKSGRVFRRIIGAKGTNRVYGKNTISKVSFRLAQLLDIENPEAFTGHCFRRTGASLLANGGASLLELQRAGRWKSSSVAQQYVDESALDRNRRASMLPQVRRHDIVLSSPVPAAPPVASSPCSTGPPPPKRRKDDDPDTGAGTSKGVTSFSQQFQGFSQQVRLQVNRNPSKDEVSTPKPRKSAAALFAEGTIVLMNCNVQFKN
jgi:hypothetical protein